MNGWMVSGESGQLGVVWYGTIHTWRESSMEQSGDL